MGSIDKWLAGLTVLVCVLLLARLCLGAARRQRFDSALRRRWQGLVGALSRWRHGPLARRRAAREAEEIIRRARERGEWQGNVYRPKSFRDKRKLH